MSFKDIYVHEIPKILISDELIMKKIDEELTIYNNLLKYNYSDEKDYNIQKNIIINLFKQLSNNKKYKLHINKLNKDFYNLTQKINNKFDQKNIIIELENIENEQQYNNIQFQKLQELDNNMLMNEIIIKERSNEIEKIHNSIIQINEIFKDLAILVNNQQSSIDITEKNIETTLDNTRQGLKEIKKAAEYNKKWCVIM